MNYRRIYNDLIMRGWRRTNLECYCEKHHIIPKCLGGDNCKSNLVKLTAAEHYIAHLLLIKIYPNIYKLAMSVAMMSGGVGKSKSSKLVSKARELSAEAHRGLKRSDATRKSISEAAKASFINNPQRGKDIAERNRQMIVTDEFRQKIAELSKGNTNMLGKHHTKEVREKISKSLEGNTRRTGKPSSDAEKERMRQRMKGNDLMLGKKHSDETKAKMSQSAKLQWQKRKDKKEILQLWCAL